MENMEQIIKDCMIQYSGAVLQSRALVDVRDCLKPSARQIFYCMYTDKFTSNKPFKKTLKAIGSAARMFIHGDSSCEGIIMRAGQSFAMRYPLIEVEGSEGNLTASGNWSAPRYTASRLSGICDSLFKDIEKNTISEWRDNYDDTEQYPSVLPSKSFYNIVNGTFGIGTGLSASIPQFNLIEVNNSLIKLLQNPNISDEEIIVKPDFATGGILLNWEEVKESLKNGNGASCKLRSVINWNEKERIFTITEIPYGVYTNTICSELEQIIESENNPGIERFNDLTGIEPLIKIYLNKKADHNKVLSYLYKNTSLQYYFGVNMTMLDKGRFPKIFTWREALQAHIDHEKEVYRKGFKFDLAKIEHRIHIIDGLLICLAQIDEVISVIKNSTSSSAASINLQYNFLLDEEQAKAVLAIKLASLAKLEVEKLEQEKINLTQEANRLIIILNNENEFNQQLINGWNEVSKKFGDSRRTIVYDDYKDEEPPKEIKNIDVYITSKDKYVVKDRSKNKLKVYKKDKIKYIMSGTTEDNFYVFTNLGKCYKTTMESFTEETEGDIAAKLNYEKNEHTVAIYNPFEQANSVYFITKLGMVNKMNTEEFLKIKKEKTILSFKDENHDELVSVLFGDGTEEMIIATKDNLAVHFDTTSFRELKSGSKGVVGIKIGLNDEVVSATLVTKDTTHIATITSSALIKRTPIEEFPVQARGTKGRMVHKLIDDEQLIEIKSLTADDRICYSENFGDIEIENIPELNRNSRGAKIF